MKEKIAEQKSVHILTFAEGLALLIAAGVFTSKQVFDWIIKGEVPKEFAPKTAPRKK
jgi:hypothetical protein